MTIRRLLLLAPTIVIIILLQSYFWVPTYEEQTRGNPQRLEEYISGSAGDASILNPILSADSASSAINGLVFEGLIDRDEDLHFRGRVARSWEIFEEAYFYINNRGIAPEAVDTEPLNIKEFLEKAIFEAAADASRPVDALSHIKSIEVLPPRSFQLPRQFSSRPTDAPREITLTGKTPARIKLVLDRVEPDLFDQLGKILGPDYFQTFSPEKYVSADGELPLDRLKTLAAELIPPTEHNPVLLFHLREGVRFHDGHLLDAGDVKFTYEMIMDPKNLSPRQPDYESVKTVEVLDPQTVKIIYKRLYSPAFGTWGMGILPEHRLNRSALAKEAVARGIPPETFSLRQSRFNRNPVGCGPFTFKEWKSDQYILLERFDHYWEGPPNYGRYVYRILPDPLTQEMEFYGGAIDSYDVQPHQVDRLTRDERFQNFSGTSFGYTYIGYNLRREPFSDLRVRKALSLAIDVDKIIKYVLYGQGERITGPFVKQTDYYNTAIPPAPYAPEKALELLRSAGWERNAEGWLEKNGKRFEFTLITNNGNDLRKAILAVAQDAWKAIGIDVRTDILEWSVFIQERVNKLDFDALILGWQMGIDPDLYQIWHSSQTGPFQLNFVGFNHAEADDLILRIRREYNYDKQVALAHRLHEIIADEQPYTFLYVGKWTAVLDKRIVIKETDENGKSRFEKIAPTKTGNYTFHFNKWIKLPRTPEFVEEG